MILPIRQGNSLKLPSGDCTSQTQYCVCKEKQEFNKYCNYQPSKPPNLIKI